MKQTKKKKQSALVPILVGVIAILVVLVGIMGFSALNQKSQANVPTVSSQTNGENAVNPSGYPAEYQIQFEQEWKKNQDFKGYLTLEGTALSTNVVQGTDNTFYREHGFDGTAGTQIAFLDYRANIETPSTQMLIYLPHANNHAKYGELVKFKNLEYYKEHPVISFNSLYKNAKYKIFSVALFPSGYEGIPYQSCMETNDKAQMVTLVQKALEHSILEIPVDVRDNDELLTVMSEDLSLVDENGKYARIVVFARKIRDGESEAVNTQKAVIKPNAHMPENWYEQILRDQYVSTVTGQIREEAAKWFTAFELSNIADADLERMLNTRKIEYGKYLTDQEMLLSAEEKAYLYEKRLKEAENPVLTLDSQNVTTRVGDEVILKVQRTPQNPNATYTWSSSKDSVVSVKGDGATAKLTAQKKGTATISVTSGKTTATCTVEVKEKNQFVLNPTSMTIFVDNSYNIKATSDIKQASSSNPNVAKVSINKNIATVYGVAPGKATITLTNENGSYATCEVTVNKYNLTFDKTTLEMKKGNRREIHVSTGEAANWYVSNTSVVKVTEVKKGKVVLVEAIGYGTATVTATARNGAQVSCKITVDGGGVAFSTTQMDMKKGEYRELQVVRGDVTKWEISDKSVANVCIYGNGTTIEVEALNYGTATIKAYGSDGSVATLTVNVAAPKESLTITPYSMTVTQGDIRNITVTSGSAKNWVSSNPSVAEVYVVGNGSMAQVEARKPGTTTITVYDQYGGWVNCNVTVEAPAAKLVIGPGTVYMNVSDWEEVSVTSGTAVDWSSSNSDVVGVYVVGGDNSKVSIKGKSAGTAQVIAHAADGSTAVCNVTVEAPYVESLELNKGSMTLTAGDLGDLRVSSGAAANWSSSNPSVAEVYVVGDGSMVQVEARAAGSATITAYAVDGSSASCSVTVEEPYVPPVAEDPLKLDQKNITINEGEWKEIYVTSGRCVDWNTTNQNVVRIYSVGDPTMIKIKGESFGTAEIIAYAADGSTTTCKITVVSVMVDEPEFFIPDEPEYTPEPEPVYTPEPEPEYTPDPEPEYTPEPEPEYTPEPEPEYTPEANSESYEEVSADEGTAG